MISRAGVRSASVGAAALLVVAPLAKLPAWLAKYVAQHPSVGVSPFPSTLDALAAEAAFTTPMPKPAASTLSP